MLDTYIRAEHYLNTMIVRFFLQKKFNLEEFQRLFDLHQRVYPSEVIVGR